MKNNAKYLSYKEAWRRINTATEAGFYFEAVTLCESIISDRLLSFVAGIEPKSRVNVRTPFASLISKWRKLSEELPSYGSNDLGVAVDNWRKDRNDIVHGMAKSTPGTATEEVEPFVERARLAAENGAKLARAVSNWHKKQMAAHAKKHRSK